MGWKPYLFVYILNVANNSFSLPFKSWMFDEVYKILIYERKTMISKIIHFHPNHRRNHIKPHFFISVTPRFGSRPMKRSLLPRPLWLIDSYNPYMKQVQPGEKDTLPTLPIQRTLRRSKIPKSMNRIMGIRLG